MIEPKPFTGEFWGIVEDMEGIADGVIEVCDKYSPNLLRRFY